jgi:hypothetical protein
MERAGRSNLGQYSHDPDPLWSGPQLTRFEHAQMVYGWHLTAPEGIRPFPDPKWARRWLKSLVKSEFITKEDEETILNDQYQLRML